MFFGNIFKRKKCIIRRLEGVSNKLMFESNPRLEGIKCQSWEEFQLILHQEEVYWYQHARTKWVTLGDNNTAFFH